MTEKKHPIVDTVSETSRVAGWAAWILVER